MENNSKENTSEKSKDEKNENLKFNALIKTNSSDVDSDTNNEHNLNLKEELKDKPVILEFIEKLQSHIKKQEKKIKKLKNKLKHNKSQLSTKASIDAATQTYEDKIEAKSLTEEIKEIAENAMLQTGFVYEETSGMYYDYNTGYYYNAELGLYYDGNTGTYMTYNNESKKYEFHSKIEVVANTHVPSEKNGKRKKTLKDQVNCFNGVDGLLQNFKELSIEPSSLTAVEVANSWPPCVRIMLKESTVPNLKLGSLFIITCDGGTLGREGNHSILISDINISKHHAKINFDKETGKYMLVDLGSRNGTVLNGKRLSASKQESEPHEIVHGSLLQVGGTKLVCHIHKGQQTCGHCEPGLVQSEDFKDKDEIDLTKKKDLHKKELRRLRKKFGIEEKPTRLAEGYSDRAENRRKFVGSFNPHEKTQVASIDQSIASNNKGFKMLSKMGWSQGQSLGKEGTGVKEPIPLVSNTGSAGLGSNEPSIPPPDPSQERKNSVWRKTQQRYNQVQNTNLEAFKLSDTDEES